MVAVNLEQIQGLPDTLLTHRFSVEFPPIPGGGDPEGLNLQCQSVSFLGSAVNPIELLIHGFKRVDFGRKEHPGTFSTVFVENREMRVWRSLKGWQEQIRGTRSGTSSARRADLVLKAVITIYDEQDEVAAVCEAFNCWPQDVPEVQLDGQSETQFLINASFQYDYVEYPGVVSVR